VINAIVQQFNDLQHLINASISCGEHGCGVVYAVEFGNNVKIGCTTNVGKRMTSLASLASNYALTTLGRIAITGYCCNQYECEAEAHKKLSEYRIGNSELFSISFETAVEVLSGLHLHVMTKQELEETEARSQELVNGFKKALDTDSTILVVGIFQIFSRIRRSAAEITDWMLDDIENGSQAKAMIAAGIESISEVVCDSLLNPNADKAIEILLDEHKLDQWLFDRISDEIEFYGVNNDAELSI